jgi:hypothetical protein
MIIKPQYLNLYASQFPPWSEGLLWREGREGLNGSFSNTKSLKHKKIKSLRILQSSKQSLYTIRRRHQIGINPQLFGSCNMLRTIINKKRLRRV